jgi:hypothetical protein
MNKQRRNFFPLQRQNQTSGDLINNPIGALGDLKMNELPLTALCLRQSFTYLFNKKRRRLSRMVGHIWPLKGKKRLTGSRYQSDRTGREWDVEGGRFTVYTKVIQGVNIRDTY